ncbi:MAG: carbon-nitrogen hydrolase family protein [Treponema sp.]|jgi:predicted amidohydrolase|nr:carbon-nitrogen hydrolase family protein [Treponema sp.]
MDKFRVALLQLIPTNNQNENLEKGIKYCKLAKELGADLALFPEMWNIGYIFPLENIHEWMENAIDINSKFIKTFQEEAKILNMAIGITYLEKWPNLPRNTLSIIDRFGNCVLTYAKIHTCDFDNEIHLTPGDDFYVTNLDTENGEIKIGAMICYDREFPESARILMLKGAEIVLVPNACPIEINRKSQLRTRAFENMIGIAMTNYAGGKVDCNGHSLAYDGIVYREVSPNTFESRDTLIIEAGEAEGIYIAEFNIENIRKYRKKEVWGNAYRKPNKYAIIISEKIEEPFIRNNTRFA